MHAIEDAVLRDARVILPAPHPGRVAGVFDTRRFGLHDAASLSFAAWPPISADDDAARALRDGA